LVSNGYELEATDADVVLVMTAVAAGAISEALLAKWLRRHATSARENLFIVNGAEGDSPTFALRAIFEQAQTLDSLPAT